MDTEKYKHLLDLLANYQRRLRHLEKQEALFGPRPPPEVLIEIEDIITKIKKIELRIVHVTDFEDETSQPPSTRRHPSAQPSIESPSSTPFSSNRQPEQIARYNNKWGQPQASPKRKLLRK